MKFNVLSINKYFPTKNENILQLYTSTFYNPLKVNILVQELGIPFEAHFVDLLKGEQNSDGFKSVNPNTKCPTIVDIVDGEAVPIFESGAILYYLAEKYNKFLPKNKHLSLQWMFFIESNFIPELRPVYFALNILKENKLPSYTRNISEMQRMLNIVEDQLNKTNWLADDEFTIADIDFFSGIHAIKTSEFQLEEVVGLKNFSSVSSKYEEFLNREKVKDALKMFN